MNAEIKKHCAEIDRCNQRGGRMLSIVDLIDAGTVSRELAAYSLAAISRGASFMAGAVPGGAGKTTVMGALLNFVPRDVELISADGPETINRGLANKEAPCCYVCHEIGRGSYYAYLWGAALRGYFALPEAGHILATNLHADTLEQAHRQICDDNQVSETAFRRMNLMFSLAVERRGTRQHSAAATQARRIAAVWESDGEHAHRQIFGPEPAASLTESSRLVSDEAFVTAQIDLERLLASNARTIAEVRSELLRHAVTLAPDAG